MIEQFHGEEIIDVVVQHSEVTGFNVDDANNFQKKI